MISVVIPCYNHSSALPGLLKSLNNQTYKDIEVVIVDDGSVDHPCEVVEGIRKELAYPVKCFTRENRGAPAARNFGASMTTGEYIIFADADLIMESTMLEVLLGVLNRNPQVSYAYSAFRFGWKKFSAIEFDANELRKMNFIHTSALIRRIDFCGFDENLKRFQDWDLWLTMLARGKRGLAVNKVLFTARVTRAGISKWRPAFWYKLWPLFGYTPKTVLQYEAAKKVIYAKHQI